MTVYNGQQIYVMAVNAGFSVNKTGGDNPAAGAGWAPAEVIAAIALGESGGDTAATANTSAEYSVGMYQINLRAHPDITEADARDPQRSTAYVYRLSQGGKNFLPWTIYKNGEYLHHLPLPAAAPGQPGVSPVAPTSTDTPPVAASSGSILGVELPTAQEWKDAGTIVAVAALAVGLIALGLYGIVRNA